MEWEPYFMCERNKDSKAALDKAQICAVQISELHSPDDNTWVC